MDVPGTVPSRIQRRPDKKYMKYFLLFGIVSTLLMIQGVPAWSDSPDAFQYFQEEAQAMAVGSDSTDPFQFFEEEAQVMVVGSDSSDVFQFFREEAKNFTVKGN